MSIFFCTFAVEIIFIIEFYRFFYGYFSNRSFVQRGREFASSS